MIYCGDGLTSNTIIRNLKVTGANGLATNIDVPNEDFDDRKTLLSRGLFYFMDGGAVKVFGKSSPVFDTVDFVENETELCGGAVSIEQQGQSDQAVTFRNCRFINNRCPGTGAAVDALQGSLVRLENCLFVNNIANYGMDEIVVKYNLSYNGQHGCGALTVFPTSKAIVERCTFTENWNGADDRGTDSRYENSIFANNNASDGSRPGHPYELDIQNAAGVKGCLFFSKHADLQGTIPTDLNTLEAPDPDFDELYVPRHADYNNAGYRPPTP